MERNGDGFALITGASRGIGKAFAEACAQRGYDLALVALPNEDLAALGLELAQKFKVTVKTLETSLSVAEAADVVMDWVHRESLRVTLLVNNAGFGTVGPFAESHIAKHQAMLYVNLHTPFLLMRRLLPMLQAQRQAYIINVASQAAFYPIPFKGTYSATKAFVMYITLAAEYELRGSNVHVSVVCPSGVKTSKEIRERIETAGAMAKWSALEPEEVAHIALKKTFQKKRLILPGRMNQISYYTSLMMPDFVKMGFISRKLKKNPFDAPEPSAVTAPPRP